VINAFRNRPARSRMPRLGPAFFGFFVGFRFGPGMRGNRSRGSVSAAHRRGNHGQAELHQEKTNLQRVSLNKQIGLLARNAASNSASSTGAMVGDEGINTTAHRGVLIFSIFSVVIRPPFCF